MMTKYVTTLACNKTCNYCLMAGLMDQKHKYPIITNLKVFKVKMAAIQEDDEIMITGGEPVLDRMLMSKVEVLRDLYDKIHITTSSKSFVDSMDTIEFDSVTFSPHGVLFDNVPHGVPIFLSIMAELYSYELVARARRFGYAGVSIQEDHTGRNKRTTQQIMAQDGVALHLLCAEDLSFSIKCVKKGTCINDGTLIIMPDLSILADLGPYVFKRKTSFTYSPTAKKMLDLVEVLPTDKVRDRTGFYHCPVCECPNHVSTESCLRLDCQTVFDWNIGDEACQEERYIFNKIFGAM